MKKLRHCHPMYNLQPGLFSKLVIRSRWISVSQNVVKMFPSLFCVLRLAGRQTDPEKSCYKTFAVYVIVDVATSPAPRRLILTANAVKIDQDEK